mmetsp:Transcript_6294/g.10223  ORF Transcript_6294/g.10223 Transcript_6294/m.10223 type:complete len:106 (-) Transcript_6294:189-506(-)
MNEDYLKKCKNLQHKYDKKETNKKSTQQKLHFILIDTCATILQAGYPLLLLIIASSESSSSPSSSSSSFNKILVKCSSSFSLDCDCWDATLLLPPASSCAVALFS